MTATVLRIRARLSCSHSYTFFFFVPDMQKDAFCLMFRATVLQHFPYSNKTTTHVPYRLVTCAECRHAATPFVCPTIPRMKSNKCWSNVGRHDNHHIVAFCNFRWPLFLFLYFGSYFREVVLLRRNPDLVRCFLWQQSQTQPRQ